MLEVFHNFSAVYVCFFCKRNMIFICWNLEVTLLFHMGLVAFKRGPILANGFQVTSVRKSELQFTTLHRIVFLNKRSETHEK
jgi:hypothetical protein